MALVISTTEWAAALVECVASERLRVLYDDVAFLYIDSNTVFHPLVAMLSAGGRQRTAVASAACVLVVQLHPHVAALARAVHAQCLKHPSVNANVSPADVLERILLSKCSDCGEMQSSTTPMGYRRAVNLAGGALFALAHSEAQAKVVLADVTSAIQCSLAGGTGACTDAQEGQPHVLSGTPLLVLIEHDEGYVGQCYSHGQVDTIIQVVKRDFSGNDSKLMCDRVVGDYEMDYRDQLEVSGDSPDLLRPEALRISVRAGYNTWASLHCDVTNGSPVDADDELVSGVDGSCFHELGFDRVVAGGQAFAQVFAPWEGIENVQAFYSKPPPSASSSVYFRHHCANHHGRGYGGRSFAGDGHAAVGSAFLQHLRSTMQLVSDLEQSARDGSHAWSPARLSSASSYNINDANEARHHFRAFLANPDDVLLLGGGDPSNTNDLSVSITIDRSAAVLATVDMDFLEKLWELLLVSAHSMQSAVQIGRELVAAVVALEVNLSYVHLSNDSWLARFIRERSNAGNDVNGTNGSDPSCELLLDHAKLLEALADLGRWRLRRDLGSWLTRLGLATHEHEAMASHAQQVDVTDSDQIENVLFLVDACALAHSLGLPGSSLRRLASGISSTLSGSQDNSKSAPGSGRHALLPLGSFLPDSLLASLQDAFVWDLHISLGDRLERIVRVCEPNFHSKCSTLASSTATFSSTTTSDDGDMDNTNMDEDGEMDPGPTSLRLDIHTVRSLCHGLPAEVLEMPALQILIANSETVPEARQKEAHGTLVMYNCSIRSLH